MINAVPGTASPGTAAPWTAAPGTAAPSVSVVMLVSYDTWTTEMGMAFTKVIANSMNISSTDLLVKFRRGSVVADVSFIKQSDNTYTRLTNLSMSITAIKNTTLAIYNVSSVAVFMSTDAPTTTGVPATKVGLSGGAIAGIVIAVAVVLAVGASTAMPKTKGSPRSSKTITRWAGLKFKTFFFFPKLFP